jgi:hypothetical protein
MPYHAVSVGVDGGLSVRRAIHAMGTFPTISQCGCALCPHHVSVSLVVQVTHYQIQMLMWTLIWTLTFILPFIRFYAVSVGVDGGLSVRVWVCKLHITKFKCSCGP